MIDIIDCSGSGDVRMYGPVAVTNHDEGGVTLIGDSGRMLQLNDGWNNPSGEWYVGSKFAYELYPKSLRKRVRAARKQQWARAHKECEMRAQSDIADPTASSEESEERTARLEQLQALGSAAETDDMGPVLDCVLWNDGELWQAAVDTAYTGDMRNRECMTDYRVLRQFSRLSEEDAMNYCLNIFPDEGREGSHRHTLSIVVDAGAHGSHVAGIVAAHCPDNPERNGVAPGAQIVSLKIGDSHLGSMETGTAMIRALIAAVKCGCHILNMSYGEAAAVPNEGVFIRLLESLVNDHGIIFVSSAGLMA